MVDDEEIDGFDDFVVVEGGCGCVGDELGFVGVVV